MASWFDLRLGQLPPLGAMETRGGRLTFVRSGCGTPAIVLINGAGVTLDGWRALYPGIERFGTVVAWNRFGVSGSDPPRVSQTGTAVVESLRELLGLLGLPPPYLLVGHSLGGLYANLYARRHPSEVAGVLFLDAAHPADREVLRRHETRLARGLASVLSLPQRLWHAQHPAEVDTVEEIAHEIAAAGAFAPVPLRVLTGGKALPAWMMSPAAAAARRAHQEDLVRLSPLGLQVMAHRSGHFPQLTEPQLVLDALAAVIEQLRPNR